MKTILLLLLMLHYLWYLPTNCSRLHRGMIVYCTVCLSHITKPCVLFLCSDQTVSFIKVVGWILCLVSSKSSWEPNFENKILPNLEARHMQSADCETTRSVCSFFVLLGQPMLSCVVLLRQGWCQWFPSFCSSRPPCPSYRACLARGISLKYLSATTLLVLIIVSTPNVVAFR